MAGGTGGHVFPALAVARQLQAQGICVKWLGTRRGLEAEVVPAAGFEIDLAPFKLVVAMLQSMLIILRHRPVAVLGVGGFVTGPGGVMSRLLGRPLVIHEQNAIAGLTNRWLSRIASRVLEAFPGTFDVACHAIYTGNPVRDDIAALPSLVERFAGRDDEPLRLLVLGGSLGAKALNEIVPAAQAQMVPDLPPPRVRHQSGRRHLDDTCRIYRELGLQAEVVPFINDMAEAYGWADLVICRAGALTIAELAAAGVAAILVPYPYAVDDHQTYNAAYLAEQGAALVMQQQDLTPATLCKALQELFGTDIRTARATLQVMAQKARQLALPDATQQVAKHCLEVAYG
jgi:UDP-N-acetylglucosamine--N-acetylmuramyl-(pentapeptide) pyrophosphoryl-undecaprenol N-acetylglucosamine transferase